MATKHNHRITIQGTPAGAVYFALDDTGYIVTDAGRGQGVALGLLTAGGRLDPDLTGESVNLAYYYEQGLERWQFVQIVTDWCERYFSCDKPARAGVVPVRL
jgi:hypothetical protein